jgi:hypothetical protein
MAYTAFQSQTTRHVSSPVLHPCLAALIGADLLSYLRSLDWLHYRPNLWPFRQRSNPALVYQTQQRRLETGVPLARPVAD